MLPVNFFSKNLIFCAHRNQRVKWHLLSNTPLAYKTKMQNRTNLMFTHHFISRWCNFGSPGQNTVSRNWKCQRLHASSPARIAPMLPTPCFRSWESNLSEVDPARSRWDRPGCVRRAVVVIFAVIAVLYDIWKLCSIQNATRALTTKSWWAFQPELHTRNPGHRPMPHKGSFIGKCD